MSLNRVLATMWLLWQAWGVGVAWALWLLLPWGWWMVFAWGLWAVVYPVGPTVLLAFVFWGDR